MAALVGRTNLCSCLLLVLLLLLVVGIEVGERVTKPWACWCCCWRIRTRRSKEEEESSNRNIEDGDVVDGGAMICTSTCVWIVWDG